MSMHLFCEWENPAVFRSGYPPHTNLAKNIAALTPTQRRENRKAILAGRQRKRQVFRIYSTAL